MARRNAFTLIELLVVIAIIALLVSILLPSMARVRRLGIQTVCRVNVRHLVLGAHMYYSETGQMLPARTPSGGLPPLHFPERHTGLLALESIETFDRDNLACPEGWASGGRPDWYRASLHGGGQNSANMDYIYWGGRYGPPRSGYDVRHETFLWRMEDASSKIVVTDAITDVNKDNPWPRSDFGFGNHNYGKLHELDLTDGRGGSAGGQLHHWAEGGSVGFWGGQVEWFSGERWTQRLSGLAYPPPDQW